MKGSAVDLKLSPVLLRGASVPAGDRSDGAAQSWQREMERAQIEAWLGHAVVGFTGTHPGTSMPMLAATATPRVATAYTPPGAALPAQGRSPAQGGCAFTPNGNTIASNSHEIPRSMPLDAVMPRLAESEALLQHHALASPMAATPAMNQISAAALVHHELAEAGDRLRLHTEPSAASPITRTARLAAMLQGLGTISATTSIRGRPAAADDASAGFAAPAPVSPDVNKVGGLQPLQGSAPARVAVGGKPSAVMAPPAVSAAGGEQKLPVADLPRSRSQVQLLTPAATADRARHAGARAASAATLRDPIRLHADWSADGVRLWLGMDASLAASLQSITAQLQLWLSAQGVRLLSISCNGRLVGDLREMSVAAIFEANATPGEAPAAANPFRLHLKEFP